MENIRDNNWLEDKLFDIWENHFNDVPRKNLVIIKFGKSAGRQLGCIRMATRKTRGISKKLNQLEKEDIKNVSVITITKYFQDESVPEEIVMGTIAHELCHYAHGFNSPLQQIYDHPHKGGVIRKEMKKRGLEELYRNSNRWLKANWVRLLKSKR